MNKVLIVSTHFAPDIHVGAKRPTKFAKFLPQFGWQPIVLTKEMGRYHGVDETLLGELPPDLPVYRVKEWSVTRAGRRGGYDGGTQDQGDRRARLKARLLNSVDPFVFYDYSWLLPATVAALRALRKRDVQLVFTTSPTPEAHLVGLFLKRIAGKKWVCEFRDPWIGHLSFPPRSSFEKKADRYLQKLVLDRADRIVVVGQAQKDALASTSGSDCRDKISVLYNGYDSDDFVSSIGEKPTGRFTITYTGTWGYFRTPEYFLRAVGSLVRTRPELAQKISVDFIGEVRFTPGMDDRIRQVIEEEDLAEVVSIVPSLPHKEAVRRLSRSHVLLLVEGSVPQKPGATGEVISAKLFEYLRARRPIMALVPPESEAAAIIRETGAGEVVEPTNIDSIERMLWKMYESFVRGELESVVRASSIERFDRRVQTAALGALFDSLVQMGACHVSAQSNLV